MLKKLVLIGACLCFGLNTLLSAQDFEIKDNPVMETTAGVPPDHVGLHDGVLVDMSTYVKNLTNSPLVLKWRNITDTTLNPAGWILIGICDNIMCRTEYDASWYFGAIQQTMPIDPAASSIMEARIYAPTDEPDGLGLFKVEISTAQQMDTLVFMLTKDSTTGIAAISLNDKRVSVYPNPASGSDLHVFIDAGLKATQATVYSIIGREQMSMPITANKELITFDVNRLPAGLYILRLTDAKGQTITSRKFSKK